MTVEERFWSHVNTHNEDEDECWEWTASRDKDGYGKFKVCGKSVRSHRFVLELNEGELKSGEHALHTCDNPPCCNPYHIYKGDQQDNMQDMINRNRTNPMFGRKYGYASGEDHGNSKTTELDVIAMRKLYDAGFTQKYIEDKFNMSHTQVCRIVNRTAWKQVQ